jgi:glucose-1-phosphate adenylyltransferase
MDADGTIVDFEEKPMLAQSNVVSTGVYVIRRRKLIELLEQCNQESRYNFVTDILVRMKGTRKIFGYMLETYWSNIASVEAYYNTNMDFLKPEVRDFFFRNEPHIFSKAYDLPPAKFNQGSDVRDSLVGSGCIINSKVEHSVLFKKVFVGNNSVIKNSIILNGAYIGDNVHVENCIVESNETLLSDTSYIGEGEIKVVSDNNNHYGV